MKKLLLIALAFPVGCAAPDAPSLSPLTQDALREADRAFMADVRQGGIDSWLSWYTEDAVRYGGDGLPVQGIAAIDALDRPFFENPSIELLWAPDAAAVFRDSLLGLTRGSYVVVDTTGDTLSTGGYTTIWRQTTEGPRAIFDFGEPSQD